MKSTDKAVSDLEQAARDRQADKPAVVLKQASTVIPKSIKWLWNGWLAKGKLHLYAGPGGVGKTTACLRVCSIVSAGKSFPDGSACEPANVVIWSGEDGMEDVLVPRLIAAGANLDNIHFVDSVVTKRGNRYFDPSKDLPHLSDKMEKIGNVGLLMVDSIADAITGEGSSNNQVRRALAPLVELSSRIDCATIGIGHFNKAIRAKVIHRILDSAAFVNVPRIVWVSFQEKDNGCLLLRAKSNIGPNGGGFRYDIHDGKLADHPDISATSAVFGESIDGSADEWLEKAELPADEDKDGGSLERAEKWLDGLMAGGPKQSKEVYRLAKENGVAERTLNRAKKELEVQSCQINGTWWWGYQDDLSRPFTS